MPTPWRTRPAHRRWLEGEADRLFRFYEGASLDPAGGFFTLDEAGAPMAAETERPLHQTSRMAHCAAIGVLLGRPGAYDLLDHAMDALWRRHRDPAHGGYYWSFDADGPRERQKLAYGHGFVLLAGASALCAGHPDADRLVNDITEVLNARFWEARYGASAEEFGEDWAPVSAYRGQNANMHLTEALMAAFEATGERRLSRQGGEHRRPDPAPPLRERRLARARALPRRLDGRSRISRLRHVPPVRLHAGARAGMGAARLQLWALGGRRLDWLPPAAARLFAQAVGQGWDEARGGLYYTLEYDGRPRVRDRIWWTICEGIGAAHFLGASDARRSPRPGIAASGISPRVT